MESKENEEQPFPDSWISTTAPIALGALTDLSSGVMFIRGANGAFLWRSTVGKIYQRWCNGDMTKWVPCEAVVRIATSEVDRFMERVTRDVGTSERNDSKVWANQLVEFYAEIMDENLEFEKEMLDMLLEEKCTALNSKLSDNNQVANGTSSDDNQVANGTPRRPRIDTERLPVETFAKLDAKFKTFPIHRHG